MITKGLSFPNPWTTAALLAGLIASQAVLAQRKAAPPKRRVPVSTLAKPALTATIYAKQVSSITDCATFREKVWSIDEATPLLRRLFVNPVAPKSEFERSDAYATRLVAALDAKVGDMSRIYTIVGVDSSNATYDADRGILTIKYGDYYSDKVPLTEELDSWDNTERSYVGSNSFGVKRRVKSYAGIKLRSRFAFQKGDLPEKLEISMTPVDAYRFKNHNGWLHILSALDGYSTDISHAEATISDPVEVLTSYRDVDLIPKCAVFTLAATNIDGWALDRLKAE